jgi:hypothetical protein
MMLFNPAVDAVLVALALFTGYAMARAVDVLNPAVWRIGLTWVVRVGSLRVNVTRQSWIHGVGVRVSWRVGCGALRAVGANMARPVPYRSRYADNVMSALRHPDMVRSLVRDAWYNQPHCPACERADCTQPTTRIDDGTVVHTFAR